jgi:hypothetical protein
MITKDTGGPAFPLFAATGYAGMTLRDYFAAKALQGMIATDYNLAPEYVPSIAASAYVLADAMLKAREQ